MKIWLLIVQLTAPNGEPAIAVFPMADIQTCRQVGDHMKLTMPAFVNYECRIATAEAGDES